MAVYPGTLLLDPPGPMPPHVRRTILPGLLRGLLSGLLSGLLLGLVLLAPGRVCAQTLEGGARSVGLAGATTALPGDAWGHGNPAAWAAVTSPTVVFFASQAYGLSELRLGAARYVHPTRVGTFTVGARSFGFAEYRETSASLGAARAVRAGSRRVVHVGLDVHYERVAIAGYGAAGAVSLRAGLVAEVAPGLQAGLGLRNVQVPAWAGREELPRSLALGLAFQPSPSATVVVDVHKDVRFPMTVRAGVEMHPVRVLALRAGVATKPSRFTAGAGLRIGGLEAGLAAERHEALGWSPAAGLGLSW